MTDDRRYTEDEVRRIFDEASSAEDDAGETVPARQGGMTLADLKRIGEDVGIAPRHVERAARSLEVRRRSGRRRMLGLPIGVGRTVELDRRLTDREWEALVVDLRETFDARGRLGGSGSFRQWTNGNLQALLEPVGDTDRLRLRTTKGSSRALLATGGIMTAAAVMIVLVTLIGGAGDTTAALELGVIGAGLFGIGAIQLPRWAAERERQMEEVATRALLMVSRDPEDGEA